jgi:hypothetical protein
VARTEQRAAHLIRDRQKQLNALHRDAPQGSTLFVIDSLSTFVGIPLVGPQHIQALMKPPFNGRAIPIVTSPWIEDLVQNRVLLTSPEPATVVEWRDQEYKTLTVLPPMTTQMPTLVSASVPQEMGVEGALRWIPTAAIAPRSIQQIRFTLTPGDASPIIMLARGGGVNRFVTVDASEDDRHLDLVLDEDWEWLQSPNFVDVLVFGERIDHAKDRPPLLLSDFESTLKLEEPTAMTTLKVGEPISLRATPLPSTGTLMLAIRFRLEEADYRMEYTGALNEMNARPGFDKTFSSEDLEFTSGSYMLTDEYSPNGTSAVSLARLPELFKTVLLPYNIHTINATIRLSVFYPGDELTTVRSRSAWVPIRFEMPAELR